ncbi:hypothetical protein [Vibrio sp. SCSIO 43136]|uniref:hypothetical protein n=1 Tax=Vibrio sp. SCSIO 43136 TaxID=2819101 RepID=UPI0020758954|nr:hypothetical protein [Vibrio sp. SCSIO 43136]USD64240.1 hypothetical protein J4N39_08965 [Vibrio sp. SCSIO 43136]
MNLKTRARSLKKTKANTKWMIVQLMKISSIDFDVDHACGKLSQYGFSVREGDIFRYMKELSSEGVLIFNGWKPIKVDSTTVGYIAVFGLLKHKLKHWLEHQGVAA